MTENLFTRSIHRRGLLRSSAALGLLAAFPLSLRVAGAQVQGDPKHGGVLTLLVDPEPPTLVPATHTGGPVRIVGPKVNEGLLDYEFDLTPRPQLATSWSVSDDGLEYTFNLREGVKWHDGRDFTSEDVAFSILFLKQNHPNGRNTFANLAEVHTPDPLTAVLVLDKPAPYLLTALAANESPIIAKHLYDGVDPLSNPVNSAPIGTGPYIFKEWERGSHIIYDRNPDYWDQPRPYVDRLVVRFISDAAARAAAIETGEVDLAAESPIPLSDVERFAALPHIGVETGGYNYMWPLNQIIFNLDNPYLGRVEVRRAIAHAIDKQAIKDVIWYGYADIANGPIVPGLKPFHAEDLPVYEFDPAKAEALLDEAGFPRGNDGIRFHLTNDYLPYGENFRRGSDYIRQALADVGIAVTVRGQDFATYIKRVYSDRDFDFANAWLGNHFDPTVGVHRLFSSTSFQIGLPFSNGAHYSNPEVDRLLEAAAVEADLSKRIELFTEFQRIILEDLPHLDLVSHRLLTIYNTRVKNHTVTGTGHRGNLSGVYIDS